MSGWVKKQKLNAIGKTQKRFFFIKDKFLFYFKEPTDEQPIGAHVIQSILAEQSTGDENNNSNFLLHLPPNLNYLIDVFDKDILQEWIQCFQASNSIDPFDNSIEFTKNVEELENNKNNFPKVSHCGFLYKRGLKNKNWQPRWFSLQGIFLIYSVSKDSKPLGCIDLRHSKITQQAENGVEHPFQIVTSLRTYFFKTDFEKSTSAWVKALLNIEKKVSSKFPFDKIRFFNNRSEILENPLSEKIRFKKPIVYHVPNFDQSLSEQKTNEDEEHERNEEVIVKLKKGRLADSSLSQSFSEPLIENQYEKKIIRKSPFFCCF